MPLVTSGGFWRWAIPALCGLLLCGCPTPEEKTGAQPAPSAPPTAASQAPSPEASSLSSPAGPVGPGPAGPGPAGHPQPEDGVPGADRLRVIPLQVGGLTLKTWVADTYESRRLGLMHVKSLPEDCGMIFVYPAAGRRAFWMENTYVPLSLAYLRSDGTIDQILDMEPLSRKTHPSQGVIRLVLEVNQGWFERHGVKVGDTIPGVSGLIGY